MNATCFRIHLFIAFRDVIREKNANIALMWLAYFKKD